MRKATMGGRVTHGTSEHTEHGPAAHRPKERWRRKERVSVFSPSSAILNRIPAAAKFSTRAEPPKERNGRGIPFVGT